MVVFPAKFGPAPTKIDERCSIINHKIAAKRKSRVPVFTSSRIDNGSDDLKNLEDLRKLYILLP